MSESTLRFDNSAMAFVLKTGEREMHFTPLEWSLIRKVVDEDLNTRYENLKAYVAMKEGK